MSPAPRTAAVALAFACATGEIVRAEPRRSGADVEVVVPVPVPPYEHERLHFFGRRHHHVVPGTVTVNRPPYACDAHARTYPTEAAFVLHLRKAHRADPEHIADDLEIGPDGVVHWIGK